MQTSDVDSFAKLLMDANAATKLFDPDAFIGKNINGDGSYPSGQSLTTLTVQYKPLTIPISIQPVVPAGIFLEQTPPQILRMRPYLYLPKEMITSHSLVLPL